MENLIGKDCRCVFSLPFKDWPFEGYPAWVTVHAVDMPMVEMSYRGDGMPRKWINASVIQQIEEI